MIKYVSFALLAVIFLTDCNNKGKIMQASFEVDGMSIRGGIL